MFVARLVAVGLSCAALVGCTSDPTPIDDTSTTSSPSPSSDPTTSTTTAETTTTSTAAEEAAVAAYLKASEDFRTCVADPVACDESVLSETLSGEFLEALQRRVVRLRDEGMVVRPPEDRKLLDISIEEFDLGEDGLAAELVACEVDAGATVQPGAGDGGADLVVDDSVSATRSRILARLEADGVWRVYDAVLIERYEGQIECTS